MSEPALEVLGVTPSRVSVLEETPANVSGRNFRNTIRIDLSNSSAPRVSRSWLFTIPGTTAVNRPAERLDSSTLALVIPAGLPLGRHDLRVTSPTGDFAGLVGALTVVGSPAADGGSGGATATGAAGAGGSVAAAGAAGAGAWMSTFGGASGGTIAAGGEAGVAGAADGGLSAAAGSGTAGAGLAGASGQPNASGGSAGEPGGFTFAPPTVIGALVDPRAFDDDPTFTADLLELYFNTTRDAASSSDDDLWVSTRATPADPWGPPTAVDTLNSSYRDTTPGIASDGLTIWFASTRPGGAGQYDLWVATRADRTGPWSAATAVSELNTPTQDVAPQVSPSGLVMVVEQNAPGGAGGHDLYLSSRSALDAPWGPPQPIAGVNTAANEYAGRLVMGGLVIIFCTDRNQATGQDIYYAERSTLSDSFSPPQPLAGVNTPAAEFDPWPSEDLRYLVFASNRDGSTELYETGR